MRELRDLPSYLEGRALRGDVLTYNELANEFGQKQVTPENWKSHPFFELFGNMDDQDIQSARPLRTALVYSAVLNRPGNGFFKTLGKAQSRTIALEDEAREWMSELERLRKFYSQPV